MLRIAIIGDCHIAPVPEKRIDNYFQVGLNKLEEVAKMSDVIIHLGDLFSNAKVDKQFENPLIRHLRKLSSTYGTKFYTIIGNHDVVHEEESNLDASSLGTLYAAGVVDIIFPDQPLILANYRFNAVPVKYSNAKDYLQNKRFGDGAYTDILLVHHEYETGTNCFTYNDFKDLGCKYIFLGHDHKPFDQGGLVYPEYSIYRPGSFMRNRADEYNLTRNVFYCTLYNNEVGFQYVNTVPASSVFKVEAVNKLEYQEKKYTEALDKLIERYENNVSTQTGFSLKNILIETLNTPPEIIQSLEKRYNKYGEVFN